MFPGQEHAPGTAAGRPLRTFTWQPYQTGSGPQRSVKAHYITYAPHHLVFMEDRPDTDRIVLAVHTDNVHNLTETTP